MRSTFALFVNLSRIFHSRLFVTSVVLAFALPAYCDSKSIARQEIPVELRASDPEIKGLIDTAADKWDLGDLEGALQDAKKAWDLCQSKGLESDLPIAGLQLSALSISKGEIDVARDLLNKSLEAAAERSNVVLEAQILVSLAALREMSGDRKGALETNTRALQKAQTGKSLYVQSRAFGEIGRMWLAAGVIKDARASLSAALDIDKANHYSLEALHRVYWIYSLLAESDQNVSTAIKGLQDALGLAQATGNTYAEFLAKNTLGAAYIYQGDLKRGLELLDVQSNKSLLLDFSRLEMLAFAYQAGHLPDKAAETWNVLLDKAKSLGNQYFVAEAAQKLGDIHRDKHEPEVAFQYYETAAHSLRAVGNKTALLQVLTSEIPLLQTAKQDDKAPLLYAETLELVQEQKGKASDNFQFVLYLGWSFFYKQQKDWTKEIDNLERAERLSTSSSADPLHDESLTKTLMAMWVDHAVAADNLHYQQLSLLAMEQAFQYALQLKDDKAEGTVMSAILSTAEGSGAYGHLRQVCDSAELQSCLESALALNTLELLNEQWRVKWQAEKGLALSKITILPEQLTASPGGTEYLTRLLGFISPIESSTRIPIYLALAKHYLFVANDFNSAKNVLLNAEPLLANAHIESNPAAEASLDQGRVTVNCWLALAIVRTGDAEAAEQRLSSCLQGAKSLGTEEAMKFAQATSSSVRLLTNNPSAAEATLYWIKTLGDTPELRRSYAYSLATGKDFDGAIREMSLACAMFEKAGRNLDLANAYASLAFYHEIKTSPDYRAALTYLDKALVLARGLHDDKEQAQIHLDLGFAYQAEGQNENARRSFTTADQLSEKASGWDVAARSVWGLAEIAEKQQEADAEVFYARAAALFSKAGILDAESQVLVKRATILRGSGRTEEAFSLLLNARDVAEQSKSNTASFNAYSAVGQAYEAAGQYANALLAFTAAYDKATAEKNVSLQAYADLAIAGICQLVGEWAPALQHATSALNDFKSLNDEKGELFAYSSLLAVYTERSSELKDFQKASSLYREASSLKAFQSESISVSVQLLEMYIQTKQYKEAIETATLLLSQCKVVKDNVCVAHAHLTLAEAHSGKGEYKAAEKDLEDSGPLVQAAHDYYLSGRFLYVRARLERNVAHLEAAVNDYSDVIQMIGTLQGGSDVQESSAISENYSFIFDELISTLYQQSTGQPSSNVNYAALALRTAEADKGQVFNKVWGARFSDAIRRRLSPGVREKESELQFRKSKLTAELRDVLAAGSRTSRPAEQIRSDLAEVDRQLSAFVSTLRTEYPSYTMIRYPLPFNIQDVPLRNGELLVECRVTEDASYLWFVSNGRDDRSKISRFYSSSNGRAWIRAQVQKIKNGISQAQLGGFDPNAVQDLTNALFPSSAYASLREAKSIIYVPDDALALVPLEMLSPNAAEGVYPLAAIPTTYYPSTEAMMISRAATSGSASWGSEMLGIGDPITSQSDPRWDAATEVSPNGSKTVAEAQPNVGSTLRSAGLSFERLPGTATEVHGIAELIEGNGGKADIRLGIDANRKRLLDTDLRNYRFLHFATHGLLPVDSGLREPALLFSFTGNPDDMFLELSQVLNLQLQSEMVVLSACNTGSGKLSKSEGVYNLGRAFLTAGASSVVVSMWEVADNSTVLFMQELYRSILKGDPKNVALMHARLALIRGGYDQPFFWAPFILMGE